MTGRRMLGYLWSGQTLYKVWFIELLLKGQIAIAVFYTRVYLDD
jgi:hypothetical protein